MPWQNDQTYELNQNNISQMPNQSGVLGFFRPDAWVYIGSTQNIREAVRRFLHGELPWVGQAKPSHLTFETCPTDGCASRCAELVVEYKPEFVSCVSFA